MGKLAKSRVKSNKKQIKLSFSKIGLIVFAVVCVLTITLGICFKIPLENMLNGNNHYDTNAALIDYNGLVVHFIDVGQGDCIALRFPDNKTMLIDAGPAESRGKLIEYLDTKFFADQPKIFNYLLLTHSDADHAGGMSAVCEKFQINKIYRPMIYYSYNGDNEIADAENPKYVYTLTYYQTIKAFEAETNNRVFINIDNCNNADRIDGEGYYFDFLWPGVRTASSTTNDFSPVMVLNYNGKKLMFTGDASTTNVENKILDKISKIDLLKVAHHGSKYSSGGSFLAKVQPDYAIIQCGESKNHPHAETLSRLDFVGSSVYRNDQNGNIIANVTSDSVAHINIYVDRQNNNYVVKIEYIICGVILITFYICFAIVPKKSNKN